MQILAASALIDAPGFGLAVADDAALVEEQIMLGSAPLWPADFRIAAAIAWRPLGGALRASGANAGALAEWYEDRLAGAPAPLTIELGPADQRVIADYPVSQVRPTAMIQEGPALPTDPELAPIFGAYAFEHHHGLMYARPRLEAASDLDLANGMLERLRLYAARLPEALTGNAADPSLVELVNDLLGDLEGSAGSLPLGQLKVTSLALQAQIAAYDDPEREASVVIRGLLGGVVAPLDALLALYPALQAFEASRLAVGWASDPNIAEINASIEQIARVTAASSVVDGSVPTALREFEAEASLMDGLGGSQAPMSTRQAMVLTQREVTGHRLVAAWNMTAEALSWLASEAVEVGGKSWDGIKGAVVEEAGDVARAGIRTALILLITHLAGPVGALALIAAGFKPLAKRAEAVKRLTSPE